ncbi:hypothetical protein MLD52_09645 [Puniceicoccaceae bacterium K14]|nr:hypothetical protein [Puniceicoccaceae bacterium K14]
MKAKSSYLTLAIILSGLWLANESKTHAQIADQNQWQSVDLTWDLKLRDLSGEYEDEFRSSIQSYPSYANFNATLDLQVNDTDTREWRGYYPGAIDFSVETDFGVKFFAEDIDILFQSGSVYFWSGDSRFSMDGADNLPFDGVDLNITFLGSSEDDSLLSALNILTNGQTGGIPGLALEGNNETTNKRSEISFLSYDHDSLPQISGVTAVPEPSTIAMVSVFGIGLVIIGYRRRQRRSRN